MRQSLPLFTVLRVRTPRTQKKFQFSGSGTTLFMEICTTFPEELIATGAYSYLPPGLTDGSTAMAVTDPVGNGGHYDLAQGAAGTEAVLEGSA